MDAETQQRCVLVCQHSSCVMQSSARILLALQITDLPEDIVVMSSGCQGQCSTSPTVRILPEETWYCRVQLSDVPLIVEHHLKRGKPLQNKLNPRIHANWIWRSL